MVTDFVVVVVVQQETESCCCVLCLVERTTFQKMSLSHPTQQTNKETAWTPCGCCGVMVSDIVKRTAVD